DEGRGFAEPGSGDAASDGRRRTGAAPGHDGPGRHHRRFDQLHEYGSEARGGLKSSEYGGRGREPAAFSRLRALVTRCAAGGRGWAPAALRRLRSLVTRCAAPGREGGPPARVRGPARQSERAPRDGGGGPCPRAQATAHTAVASVCGPPAADPVALPSVTPR